MSKRLVRYRTPRCNAFHSKYIESREDYSVYSGDDVEVISGLMETCI
jgi:hypothetical protein